MTIDILVVAYCGWTALGETLASIARFSEPGYRLTVFENGVRNYPLTWLWNRFAEASTRDVLALCNPDILVAPGWDAEAVACFELHPDCGVVCPLSNTQLHREQLASPVPDALELEDVEALAARLHRDAAQPRFVLGADHRMTPAHCALIPRAAWSAVGGFDERVPFGGNDYDFNRRIADAGMRLAVATRTFSFHRWGVSTSDARRLGQFDEARHQPRFRTPPAGVPFHEL